MIKTIDKYPVLSIILFVILMLGFTVDVIPVSIMEARNFISAREMVTDGNWLLPTMNGEPRYEKPPLPTWITATFGYVFGFTNVLALRLPSIIMVSLLGICSYLFSLKIFKHKSKSIITGFLTITSFYVLGIALESPVDIYAHTFMFAAIYQLFKMLHTGKIVLKSSLLFVLFIAASVLSKGPVSLYVLLLSFLIAYGISFRFKKHSIYLYLKLGLSLFLGIGIGALWYMYVAMNDTEAFIKITSTETANWSSYEIKPFYYYWSFFAQTGVWVVFAFVSLLYPYLRKNIKHRITYKFTFFWTIAAVILLSIIPEKKTRYVMPVLIPLALNMSFYVNYMISKFGKSKSKKECFPVYFQFILIAIIAIIFPISGFFIQTYFQDFSWVQFALASTVSITLGFLILKSLKAKNIKKAFYTVLLFLLSIGLFVLPLIKPLVNVNYKPLASFKSEGLSMYSLNKVTPEMLYYYGKKIPSIGYSNDFKSPEDTSFYLLTISESIKKEFSKTHNIEFIKAFDLNVNAKHTKNRNDRLVNYLYRLKRK